MIFTVSVDCASLAEAEAVSARIEDGDLAPLSLALHETDEALGRWAAVACFACETDARSAARDLTGAAIGPLPETDWVRQSLAGLGPVSAGRFFLHGSHDRARRRAGGLSLEIDAGTAFGTGHHPTTLGCLAMLDALAKCRKPRRVLDAGCGSGVLAIGAAALGARVLASDIDAEAVRVTRINARINGWSHRIRAVAAAGLAHPAIRAGGPYDLIFANILARPLLALAGDLTGALAPRGVLILAGLTESQERRVFAAYRNRGLVPLGRRRDGGWSLLAFTQKAKRPGR